VMREIKAPADLEAFDKKPLTVIVPIQGWDRLSERALRIAEQISKDITAVYICTSQSPGGLPTAWKNHVVTPAQQKGVDPSRLKIITSPYRRFLQPLLDYVEDENVIVVNTPWYLHEDLKRRNTVEPPG